MNSPSVAVVIPAHNAAPFLKEAVESALGQSRPPDEVVVVDDASTDATPAVIRAFGDRVKSLRVECRNVGGARNRGVAAAGADYVAFLDADDLWRPEKLEVFLGAAAARPDAGLIYSDAQAVDARGRGRRGLRTGPVEDLFTGLLAGARLVTSAVMARRSLFDGGGFREDFRCPAGVEDWEFWIRAARRAPSCHVAAPLTLYRVHGGSAIQTRRQELRDDGLRVLALHEGEAPAGVVARGRAAVHYESAVRHLAALDGASARADLAEAARHPAFALRARVLSVLSAAGPGPLRALLAARRFFLAAALRFQ